MSFFKALEKMRQFQEEMEDAALSAITTGQNIADDFWNNFILVCNNKDGVASLLGVTTDKVATWQQKVQEALDNAKNAEPSTKVNRKIIDTGGIDNEELS
jgi:hypothetical protein